MTAGFKRELGTARRLGHREIDYHRIQGLSVTPDQLGVICVNDHNSDIIKEVMRSESSTSA